MYIILLVSSKDLAPHEQLRIHKLFFCLVGAFLALSLAKLVCYLCVRSASASTSSLFAIRLTDLVCTRHAPLLSI